MTAETILAKAVDDLETRMGVPRAEILPGEYLALSKAALKCANPFEDIDADAAGWPVRVADGVYLWPLTIGAIIWLDRLRKWCEGDDDASSRFFADALAYAAMNSRRKDAFIPLDTREKAEKAVRASLAKCPVTPAEMDGALDRLFKKRRDSHAEPSSRAAFSWAALCARLEARTGIPAKDWIWEKSGDYVLKCYAELEEFAYRAALQSGGKPFYIRLKDELDDAMEELQCVKVAIMRRVREGGGRHVQG